MTYIDGTVLAVPTVNKQAYIDHARAMGKVFIEYGAKRLVEGWGDDVPHGKTTDFYRATLATEDEAVLFSWIEWPDKAARDAGWEKIMADPRMKELGEMPFDGKRMIFGGFDGVLTLPQSDLP